MGLDFERESRELLGESALVPYTVCVALALGGSGRRVFFPPAFLGPRAFSSCIDCEILGLRLRVRFDGHGSWSRRRGARGRLWPLRGTVPVVWAVGLGESEWD